VSTQNDSKKTHELSSQEFGHKVDLPLLKFIWQSNPLINSNRDTIPKFLKKLDILKNFSDYELKILTKFIHLRKFSKTEIIFKENDIGIGFYFIYSGLIDISVAKNSTLKQVSQTDSNNSNIENTFLSETIELTDQENEDDYVLTLEKYDYFGELAILQDSSTRSATAKAKDQCELLGIFKPDIEEMTLHYPLLAAKLIQTLAVVVANRLYSITKEVKRLKYKIHQLELENEQLRKRNKE